MVVVGFDEEDEDVRVAGNVACLFEARQKRRARVCIAGGDGRLTDLEGE